MKEIFDIHVQSGSGIGFVDSSQQAVKSLAGKPTLVRLTLARKIAAITLTLWKKGENFDAEITPTKYTFVV